MKSHRQKALGRLVFHCGEGYVEPEKYHRANGFFFGESICEIFGVDFGFIAGD